jgi:hypothetical protein
MARAVALCAVLVVLAAVLAPSAAVRAPAVAPAAASAEEEQCDVDKLAPCAPAILGGRKPSAECCSVLKAQQGCFCEYAKDPAYEHYVHGPNARNTLTTCGITLPTCPK